MTGKVRVGLLFLGLALAGMLAGCTGLGGPAPVPTVMLDDPAATSSTQQTSALPAGETVVASGNIAASRETRCSAATSGQVLELTVQEGQRVKAGDLLVRLAGSERMAAALESAEFELLAAQQARKHLDDRSEADRAAAQLRLARANQVLEDAERKRTWRQYRNGSDSMIQTAQADLILANDRLDKAQDAYNSVSSQDDFSVTKAGALSALAAARSAHNRALANLDYLLAMPDPIEVELAEAELVAARAEAANARTELEKLENGADPEAVALADARIQNAQAQVAAAQAALNDLEVQAPADGTVSELMIQPGEWVQPGQPLLVLIDLDHLFAETTDLSERDVTQIALGQEVLVKVKALGAEVNGRVLRISVAADTLGGDVVYKTTIELDSIPAGILPGMSVDAYFE